MMLGANKFRREKTGFLFRLSEGSIPTAKNKYPKYRQRAGSGTLLYDTEPC